jgi:ATP-dependent Clp protease ATP-binding subunit ClpB
MRQFPQLQHSYVIEFVLVCADEIEGPDWQFSCSISSRRMTETHGRLRQVNAEGNEDMKAAARQQLDPTIRSTGTRDFEGALRSKIVGQAEGVQALVDLYQVFCAGLNSPGRPVGNLLFLGPTGSGKTRIVEAAAEILFGDGRAVIKVDCAEFQHSHEIAKLIGSPPGYLGHRETHPLITQEALAASHTEKLKLSFLLFDEIEKASDALWQLLLGMLDKATLTLGDNRRVDLSQTVIFLTSNLGGGEITELMNGGMGFIQPKDKPAAGLDQKVERTAVEAARRKFSPEFMNRLDKVVVFHPLHREQLEEVLEIELGQVQQRVLETAKGQFLFRVTASGREFLLQEGTDQRYGARHLKRAIERHVVYPLANLLATEQVHLGDLVCIDWSKGNEGLSFVREGENLAIPARRPEPVVTARSTQARSGKSVEAPSTAIGPEPTPRMAR